MRAGIQAGDADFIFCRIWLQAQPGLSKLLNTLAQQRFDVVFFHHGVLLQAGMHRKGHIVLSGCWKVNDWVGFGRCFRNTALKSPAVAFDLACGLIKKLYRTHCTNLGVVGREIRHKGVCRCCLALEHALTATQKACMVVGKLDFINMRFARGIVFDRPACPTICGFIHIFICAAHVSTVGIEHMNSFEVVIAGRP